MDQPDTGLKPSGLDGKRGFLVRKRGGLGHHHVQKTERAIAVERGGALLDAVGAEVEALGDLAVGLAGAEQEQDLALAIGEGEAAGGGGYVFAFDAADLTENIEGERPVGSFIGCQPEDTIEPIRRLKAIAAERGFRLLPGHDPVVWPAASIELAARWPAER